MRVMIVVTHLLGTGHLTRAVTLAKAFKQAGDTPIVVSGGLPVARLKDSGINIVQLQPLRSDGVDFNKLLGTSGALADSQLMQGRIAQLTEALTEFQPDALITELFPFGRRILKEEFTALLEHAQSMPHPPAVFASIRDILAPPSKLKKVEFADQIITDRYDAVLVHSDPDITPLDLSWPVSEAMRCKLHYTGFVALPPATPHPEHAGTDEVIVSAGGGPVGQNLFQCARTAAAEDPSRRWRLLVGGQDAQAAIEDLRYDASRNLIVEPTRPDFRQMLHHAAVSISFCGYNTAQDILQTSCPAVFVPFDEGGEVEQGIRAKALGALDGIEVLPSSNMTPAALLRSVEAAISAPQRTPSPIADGACKTVQILREFCDIPDGV